MATALITTYFLTYPIFLCVILVIKMRLRFSNIFVHFKLSSTVRNILLLGIMKMIRLGTEYPQLPTRSELDNETSGQY